jgi:hypothetical protein
MPTKAQWHLCKQTWQLNLREHSNTNYLETAGPEVAAAAGLATAYAAVDAPAAAVQLCQQRQQQQLSQQLQQQQQLKPLVEIS